MKGFPSLLGALGLVAILFALASFMLLLFGAPTSPSWIFGNLGIGILLLGSAMVMNIDSLRERMRTGEARRAGKYGTSAILTTGLSLAILGMLGFLSTRYHVRFDWTEQKVHSLSDQSQKVLANLDRDVEVVAFYDPLQAAPVRELLERYDYASDRFAVVEFADPNARPDLLERYDVDPDRVGKGLLRVAMGEESVEIDEPTEEKITNAMVKLSRSGQKTVYFLEGHNERAIDGEAANAKESYARAADALRNENYQVESLLLAAKGEVPEDADVVIIAGATRPLLGPEHTALESYLARGGALLMLVDPRARTDLVDRVRKWGINIGDDVIVDRTLALFGRATTPFAGKYDGEHEITRDLREATLFHFVRSVSVDEDARGALTEIVFTGDQSWAERDLESFFADGRAELGDDDLPGPVPIAVAGLVDLGSDGSGDSDAGGDNPKTVGAARLSVFGDADFASNELIEAYRNRDLFVNTVNWLLGDIEAISIRPQRSRASRFQPTAQQFERIRVLSLLALPEALAILGVITWWTRRQGSSR